MRTDLTLHHCSVVIAPGSLEFVLKLFSSFNSNLSYRIDEKARWALVKEAGKNVEVQLIEFDQIELPLEHKRNNHIAFISEDPQGEIEKIKKFAQEHGRQFETHSWSDEEFYFDCPGIFLSFVIEVMDKRILQ